MQTREVERRFKHDEWMEEQKRNLFAHKVADLAAGANPTVDKSVITSPVIDNFASRPT